MADTSLSVDVETSKRICLYCGAPVKRGFGKDRSGNKCTKIFCARDCYNAYRKEYCVSGKTRKEGLERNCANCGKPFMSIQENQILNNCSWACRVAYKRAKPRNCVNCGCLFTPVRCNKKDKRISSAKGGKTCSPRCGREWNSNNEVRKAKIGAACRGDKSPSWEGGKSYASNRYRGPNWKIVAEKARKRDKYTCQECGKTESEVGRKLDVHHIIPYHNFLSYKQANNMKNLITLCPRCHQIIERKTEARQFVFPFSLFDQEARQAKRGEAT